MRPCQSRSARLEAGGDFGWHGRGRGRGTNCRTLSPSSIVIFQDTPPLTMNIDVLRQSFTNTLCRIAGSTHFFGKRRLRPLGTRWNSQWTFATVVTAPLGIQNAATGSTRGVSALVYRLPPRFNDGRARADLQLNLAGPRSAHSSKHVSHPYFGSTLERCDFSCRSQLHVSCPKAGSV